MKFLDYFKRSDASALSVMLLSLPWAAALGAPCGGDSPQSIPYVGDPGPVEEVGGAYPELKTRYFQLLDNAVAGFRGDTAGAPPERLAAFADELLSNMVEDVPIVYVRAYLAQEIGRAAPPKKKWLQRLFDRVNELRAMNDESARALIADSARNRRVSTLLLCLSALRVSSIKGESANALAGFNELRVVFRLCKALEYGAPGGGLEVWLDHIALNNAIIKSLSTLTGLELALIRPPPRSMRDGEDEKQFAARLVAAKREVPNRSLDAAVRCVQWLRINQPQAATFEAECGDASKWSRPLAADAEPVDELGGFFGLRGIYFHVIGNLLMVLSDPDANAGSDTPVPASQQPDELLSKMLEAIPIVYVRTYLERAIPDIRINTEKELLQRLLDRLDALRAVDRASARAIIADAARQGRVSTLMVCVCAFRDPSSRGEAAEALASFNERRGVRCLCTVLAVMSRCAPAARADVWMGHIALQNAIIKSLSTSTRLDLALVDPPPHSMRDGEDEKQFAARLVATRRAARDRCLDAVKRCEQWLENEEREGNCARESDRRR